MNIGIGKSLKTLTLEKNSNAILNCTFSSLPDGSVSWALNGKPAPFNQSFLYFEYGSGSDLMPTNDHGSYTQYSYLHLLNFQVCHQGIYLCIVNSSNARIITFEEYNVTMSSSEFSSQSKLFYKVNNTRLLLRDKVARQ